MLRPHKRGDELVRSLGTCLISGSPPSRDLTGRSSRIQTESMRRHYLLLALSGLPLNCFGQNSSDWSKVAELGKQPHQKPPARENPGEFYAGRKTAPPDAPPDFISTHPPSPHPPPPLP